jgi:hypothetical protein
MKGKPFDWQDHSGYRKPGRQTYLLAIIERT